MSRNLNKRVAELEKQIEFFARKQETQRPVPADLKHRARILANVVYRARLEGDPEKIALIAKSLKEAQRRIQARTSKAPRNDDR